MGRRETELANAWKDAARRAMAYARTLTKNVALAEDLAQSAMAAAVDPDKSLWNPDVHPDLASHVCNLVYSRYGNQKQSYRVTKASRELTDELMERDAAPDNPEGLLVVKEAESEADAGYAALLARVAGDALVRLLLEDDVDDARSSTDRALAEGYSLDDVELARSRLKRHIRAVTAEAAAQRGGDRSNA